MKKCISVYLSEEEKELLSKKLSVLNEEKFDYCFDFSKSTFALESFNNELFKITNKIKNSFIRNFKKFIKDIKENGKNEFILQEQFHMLLIEFMEFNFAACVNFCDPLELYLIYKFKKIYSSKTNFLIYFNKLHFDFVENKLKCKIDPNSYFYEKFNFEIPIKSKDKIYVNQDLINFCFERTEIDSIKINNDSIEFSKY